MEIVSFAQPLHWGQLDLPLWALAQDWSGKADSPSAFFSLALDPHHLWFIAGDRRRPHCHPHAQPGKWCEELWRYDVAELFVGHRDQSSYMEFNLAPSAAWWQQTFCQPRVVHPDQRSPLAIETFAELATDGSWLAAMKIPRGELETLLLAGDATSRNPVTAPAALDWNHHVRLNVCLILESPQQRFYSFTPLPGDHADFHQPQHFSPVRLLATP